MPTLHVIVRSSDEKTEKQLYHQLLDSKYLTSSDITVLKEKPFWRSLEAMTMLAKQTNADYYAVIDADILLLKSTVSWIFEYIEVIHSNEYVGGAQFSILDYLFGGPRSGGIHLYKSELLKVAKDFIDDIKLELRPETKLKNLSLSKTDTIWKFSNLIIGLHDYGQYSFDYFRKGYFFAQKHRKLFDYFRSFWASESHRSNNYFFALRGLELGSNSQMEFEFTSDDKYILNHWNCINQNFSESPNNIIYPDDIVKSWLPTKDFLRYNYRKIVYKQGMPFAFYSKRHLIYNKLFLGFHQ